MAIPGDWSDEGRRKDQAVQQPPWAQSEAASERTLWKRQVSDMQFSSFPSIKEDGKHFVNVTKIVF